MPLEERVIVLAGAGGDIGFADAREPAGSGVTANVLQAKSIVAAGGSGSGRKAGTTTMEEVAAAILYLLSDEAAPVNGAKLALDGR